MHICPNWLSSFADWVLLFTGIINYLFLKKTSWKWEVVVCHPPNPKEMARRLRKSSKQLPIRKTSQRLREYFQMTTGRLTEDFWKSSRSLLEVFRKSSRSLLELFPISFEKFVWLVMFSMQNVDGFINLLRLRFSKNPEHLIDHGFDSFSSMVYRCFYYLLLYYRVFLFYL